MLVSPEGHYASVGMKRNEKLILVVVTLCAILLLLGLLHPASSPPSFDTRGMPLASTMQLFVSLSTAFKAFRTEYGRFPTGDQSVIC